MVNTSRAEPFEHYFFERSRAEARGVLGAGIGVYRALEFTCTVEALTRRETEGSADGLEAWAEANVKDSCPKTARMHR